MSAFRHVPDHLIGAWRRESMQVEDDPPFEDSHVIWLQARSFFADIRTPLPGQEAGPETFGGTIEWLDPHLTFNHDLDLTGNFAADKGELSFEDDARCRMIEKGSVDLGKKVLHYQEVWIRESEMNPAYRVLGYLDKGELQALLVTVDSWGILLKRGSELASTYFVVDGGEPKAVASIGEQPLFSIPELSPGETIEIDGLSWECLEAG